MPEENEKNEPKYAGFWIRFLALIIDSIIVSIVFSPILNLFFPAQEITTNFGSSTFTSMTDPAGTIRNLIFLVYAILMLNYYGATLGKMIFGLKVVSSEDLKPLSVINIVIRETIGKFLSAIVLGLGYIWAGFDPKKQAWHDKIAKSYVIYSK